MLKAGALLIFAALAAAPSIPPSQSHQQAVRVQSSQKPDSARHGEQNADSASKKAPNISAGHKVNGSDNREKRCGYECERRADERSEYWSILGHRMKITDFFLAIFTGLLFVAGVVQSLLLFLSIRDSTRQHIISNRAFVFLENFDISHTTSKRAMFDPTISGLSITPKWKNSGQTPTRNLTLRTTVRTIVGELPPDFDYPYPDPPIHALCGPQANEWSIPVQIVDIAANNALDRQTNIYVWGRADYDDVFKKTPHRFTQFCSRIHFHRTSEDIRVELRSYGTYNRSEVDDA